MAKCTACGKFTGAKGVATCSKCSNKYHLACADLPDSAKVGTDWRCVSCRSKGVRNTSSPGKNVSCGNESTPVQSTPSCSGINFEDAANVDVEGPKSPSKSLAVQLDIRQELRLLRQQLHSRMDELRADMKDFRQEMAEIRQSVRDCNYRVDGMEARLRNLETQAVPAASEGIVEQLESTVAQLKFELNDREQELLSSDLEIANLPEEKGENVLHVVDLVAKKLGVALHSSDIVFAERVGPRLDRSSEAGSADTAGQAGAEARGRRIVVRLARRQLRDDLLRSARVRRGVTSEGLGFAAPPRRFYLNERLTRTNKQLFYSARQASNLHGWRFIWTRHGRILAKQADGKRTFTIRSVSDIERVFSGGKHETKKD